MRDDVTSVLAVILVEPPSLTASFAKLGGARGSFLLCTTPQTCSIDCGILRIQPFYFTLLFSTSALRITNCMFLFGFDYLLWVRF